MNNSNLLIQSALISTILMSTAIAHSQATSPEIKDGSFSKDGSMAFDAEANTWVNPSTFWRNYAKRNGGLTYGITKEYPSYSKTSEYDTLIIVTDKGECMMEFFHQRWRRANDVRRWDNAFNDYGGCLYVFD